MIDQHKKWSVICNVKFAFVALLIWVFSACTKDPGIEETGVRLRFMNASPDAAAVQFNLNGQKAYTPALAYGDTTSYLVFTGGTYNLTSEVGTKTVVNTVVDFIPKKNYTLFMIDSAYKSKLVVYKDELDVISAPFTINLRFLNLIPDAPVLGIVGVTNSDTIPLSSGKAFNAGSTTTDATFQTYPTNIYEIWVISATNIIARLPARAFSSTKYYTIYVRGFLKGTANQAPAIGIIQHN